MRPPPLLAWAELHQKAVALADLFDMNGCPQQNDLNIICPSKDKSIQDKLTKKIEEKLKNKYLTND